MEDKLKNDYADIKLILKPQDKIEWQSGEAIQGFVSVFPKIAIGIYYLKISIIFEIRGEMVTDRKVLHTILLEKKANFEQAQQYTYPFKFILTQAGSYKGQNAQFYYSLETNIDFDSRTDQIVRHESFKKLSVSRAVYPEKGTKNIQFLEIKSTHLGYFTQSQKTNVKSTQTEKGFGTLIRNAFLKKRGGEIFLELKQRNQDQFAALFSFEKDLSEAKKIVSYYQIIEKVIDRRGTDIDTNEDIVFASNKQVKTSQDHEVVFTYSYPPTDFPPSLEYKDFEIIWELVLEITFGMGLMIKVNQPLKVHYFDKKLAKMK